MRHTFPSKYALLGASLLTALTYNLYKNETINGNQLAFMGLCLTGLYLLTNLQKKPEHPFTKTINQYCTEKSYIGLELSQAEVKQLCWLQHNEIDSPERRQAIKPSDLNMEIKRSLARAHSLQLFLSDKTDLAYHTFIKDQADPITLSQFRGLAERAKILSQDAKIAVRASCFLTKSQRGDQVFYQNGVKPKQDSEVFLTQLALIPKHKSDIFPVVAALSTTQFNYLQKAFWPESHLRHMLLTEGGNTMFESLASAFESGVLNEEGLTTWEFRWLTNLAGFRAHEEINYLDETVLSQTLIIFNKIQQCLHKKGASNFLLPYLEKQAYATSISPDTLNKALTKQDIHVIGHLAAFGNIRTPEAGEKLLEGYLKFLNQSPDNKQLAQAYSTFVNDPETVTPTYTPAIFTTAIKLLTEDKTLTESLNGRDPLVSATVFTCTILKGLYQQDCTQRISCRNIAWFKNMKPMLNEWLEKPSATMEFNLEDDELQLAFIDTTPSLAVK